MEYYSVIKIIRFCHDITHMVSKQVDLIHAENPELLTVGYGGSGTAEERYGP